MLLKEEQKKREKFRSILREIAISQELFKDQNKLQDVYLKLQDMYRGNTSENEFRHYYSDIFAVLSSLRMEGKCLDILNQNLYYVYEYSKKKEADSTFCDKMKKLVDHTSLEIARMSYIDEIESRRNLTEEDIIQTIDYYNEEVEKTIKKLEDAQSRINHSYSDFIAILGIFAGIVLVFFGGTSVLGSIINNIQKMETAKAIMMCTITGLTVFNTIFMFIYYISKLLNRDISATSEFVYWKPIIVRFKCRYPLVFWVNVVSVILILICGIYITKEYWLEFEILHGHFLNFINYLYTEYRAILLTIVVGAIGNMLFIVAYIVSKIYSVNIGSSIYRSRANWIDWMFDENTEQYVVTENDVPIKAFNDSKRAIWYADTKRNWLEFKATMKTVFMMLILRYPYMTIFNGIILLRIFLIAKCR